MMKDLAVLNFEKRIAMSAIERTEQGLEGSENGGHERSRRSRGRDEEGPKADISVSPRSEVPDSPINVPSPAPEDASEGRGGAKEAEAAQVLDSRAVCVA
jgi:hypothetical protein